MVFTHSIIAVANILKKWLKFKFGTRELLNLWDLIFMKKISKKIQSNICL